MTLQERQYLQSEYSNILQLLAEVPLDRVIERIGLESRKQEIEIKLSCDRN